MKTTFQQFEKAPNLLYMAVIDSVKNLAKGDFGAFESPAEAMKKIHHNINTLLPPGERLHKELKLTGPQQNPKMPNLHYINVIWDTKEKAVLLCQLTCGTA